MIIRWKVHFVFFIFVVNANHKYFYNENFRRSTVLTRVRFAFKEMKITITAKFVGRMQYICMTSTCQYGTTEYLVILTTPTNVHFFCARSGKHKIYFGMGLLATFYNNALYSILSKSMYYSD